MLFRQIKQIINTKEGKNSIFLILEKVILGLGVFWIGVEVAKYLGPERYGILSYALSLVSILIPFTKFAYDTILIRELTLHQNLNFQLLKVSLLLNFFGSLVGFFVLHCLFCFFKHLGNSLLF